MIPEGKGIFIWKIPNCEKGDPEQIALEAKRCGFSHVLIKIANGIYDYNYNADLKKDLVTPVAESLSRYNIKVWGWHYVFGDLPKKEAEAAIRQINKIPLSGYVIDAEAEYKGKYNACRIFMNELRNALPDLSVGLSSFRYPKYHYDLPWTDFLDECQFNMPQVYWEQSRNPGQQLERSHNEFSRLFSPTKPIVPTGSAYGVNNWYPHPGEIIEFMSKAVELNLLGFNFWSWDYCRRSLPDLWQAIASFEFPTTNPEQNLKLPESLAEKLNNKDLIGILNCYQSDAVIVTLNETKQGIENIKEYYKNFFKLSNFLKNYTITRNNESKKIIEFHWCYTNSSGYLINGKDTIILHNGKILYHFSSSDM